RSPWRSFQRPESRQSQQSDDDLEQSTLRKDHDCRRPANTSVRVEIRVLIRRRIMRAMSRVLLCSALLVSSSMLMLSETHRFTPTVCYSTYSFAHPPALRIKPGDRVITKTLDAGGSDETGKQVASIGANPEIGPFYIEGAEPGDVLVVTFEKIETNRTTSFSGTELSPYTPDAEAVLQRQPGQAPRVNWMIDKEKGLARLELPELKPSVMELPLRPMLGCVAVAPARQEAILSTVPGPWGGN